VTERLARLGLRVPEVLLPRPGVDLRKWAVIACDQFTQDRAYWEKVRDFAGGAPSTLNLIYPEIYLEDPDKPERIRNIHRAMAAYMEGVFAPARRCCVYLERRTPLHGRRRGLLLALDLEAYDWSAAAKTLVRATEGTVPGRLPPRMEIRRGAPLECPHVLVLIDDQGDEFLPRLGELARQAAPLYDTELMLGAGHVTGWALEGGAETLAAGLEALARRALARYERGTALPVCRGGRQPLPGHGQGGLGGAQEGRQGRRGRGGRGGQPRPLRHGRSRKPLRSRRAL